MSAPLRPAQSRRGSLLEACANVAIGYGVNLVGNLLILPAFGLPVSLGQAAGIGVAFTAISIARSYVIRRLVETWRR